MASVNDNIAHQPRKGNEVGTSNTPVLPQDIGTDPNFKREIVWFNAIGFLIMHLCAIYGLYLSVVSSKIPTNIWAFFLTLFAGESVTLGAHRMYSHKSFKGTFLLRLIVVTIQTISGQNCLYIWVRDHRQHHKYSDTDADPHNANRGFFFSHIGWLMSRKHPLVIEKGKQIDMSDLEADPLVMLQKEYYKPLYVLLALALPVTVPVFFWNESWWNSLFVSYFLRYVVQLNATWLINSATHMYGMRPYDRFINPVENALVSFIALGEGWHNYHHAFPWDYRAAEFGLRYSFTTYIIDWCADMGLAYNLRTARPESVKSRLQKRGDGSHHTMSGRSDGSSKQHTVWQFMEDMDADERENVVVHNPRGIDAKG